MQTPSRAGRTLFAAAGFYAMLAVAVTWPLAVSSRGVLPHDLGDPLLSTTLLWWNAHVVPLTAAWWNGPWFHPATGAVAFSDPRLGASLIASPLQWLGTSPVTAYNITLIASFPLCAMAAFGLVLGLTGRRDAAALAGLAFGFNPYRIAHIEHLELLLAYAMPIALMALHRYTDTRRPVWLAVLAAALALLGLSASYYLLFFSVFVALWIVWFVPWRDWRLLARLTAASAAGVLLLAPMYVTMWRIHQAYDYRRSGEAENFSADVTSIATASPMLAAWGWTAPLNGAERQTFPGLTIILLATLGALHACRQRRVVADGVSRVSRALWLMAAAVVLLGIAAAIWGPVDVRAGPVRLRMTEFFKTFSIVTLLGTIGLLLSGRVRDAHRHRSALAFYGLATLFLWLCSLGPEPRVLGRQWLYQPPYAWLMHLPGFSESVRAPARFAMPAALALSVAGALGYTRLASARPGWRAALALLCGVGIAADTWPASFPLLPVPAHWTASMAGVTAVMELPLGPLEQDAAAMYRSTYHRVATVNGMSGSMPPHYRALQRAVRDGDESVVQVMASAGALLVAVDGRDQGAEAWASKLARQPGTIRQSRSGPWTFFHVEVPPASALATPACDAPSAKPASVANEDGPLPIATITDDSAGTAWFSRFEAPYSTVLTIDLGRPMRVCSVGLSLGSTAYEYPGDLAVEVSADGEHWTPAHTGSIAAAAVRAALRNQLDARVEVPIAPVEVRLIRLRRTASETSPVWAVAEVFVRGR